MKFTLGTQFPIMLSVVGSSQELSSSTRIRSLRLTLSLQLRRRLFRYLSWQNIYASSDNCGVSLSSHREVSSFTTRGIKRSVRTSIQIQLGPLNDYTITSSKYRCFYPSQGKPIWSWKKKIFGKQSNPVKTSCQERVESVWEEANLSPHRELPFFFGSS